MIINNTNLKSTLICTLLAKPLLFVFIFFLGISSLVHAQLSGTYTIGSTGQYSSFTDAINELTTLGVSDSVIFDLLPGTYNEQIVIDEINGVNSTNTITFQSQTGNQSDVILEFAVSSGDANYVINLNGADYITFQNMTISVIPTSRYNRLIELSGDANYNKIANNTLNGRFLDYASSNKEIIYSRDSSVDNTIIQGNTINNGSYGVWIYGVSSSNLLLNIQILNNTFNNQYHGAIYLRYHDSPHINSNIIVTSSENNDYCGIYIRNGDNNLQIQKNKIKDIIGLGIELYQCDGAATATGLVANNFIHVRGNGEDEGVRLRSCNYHDIFYNSINITSTSNKSKGLYISGGENNNVINNVFANIGGGYAYYVVSTTSVAISDYNDLYTSGNILAYWNDDKSDLSTLRMESGKDLNSVSVNPEFVSSTDLHSSSFGINNLGTPLSSVTEDIDSEPRDANSPDIGADEFNPGQIIVTFNLDLRPLYRLGLFRPDLGMRPIIDVFDSEHISKSLLTDIDYDSIWSVDLGQESLDTLKYIYAIDPDGDGLNSSDEWIYELEGTIAPRTLTIATSVNIDLQPQFFDELQFKSIDSEYVALVTHNFLPGETTAKVFSEDTAHTYISINTNSLDRSAIISVRRYRKGAGGSPPSGINIVAENVFWGIEIIPKAVKITSNIIVDYEPFNGITQPNDLRILQRKIKQNIWKIIPTDVDIANNLLTTFNMSEFGEMTLGSVSDQNPLIPQKPAIPNNPQPLDEAIQISNRPYLSWSPVYYARTYDIYLWKITEEKPQTPMAVNFSNANYQVQETLPYNITYNWQVLAKNIDGKTEGPVWTFTVEGLPDLIVSEIQAPVEAWSGDSFSLKWVVTNIGDNSVNIPKWNDAIYLSPDSLFDKHDFPLKSFYNTSHLGVGESYVTTQDIDLPIDLVGNYYVFVMTDGRNISKPGKAAPPRSGNKVLEADEENNYKRSTSTMGIQLTPPPDLQVTSVIVPSNAFSGQEINVQYNVKNSANGPTTCGRWYDALYLSKEKIINENAIQLGDRIKFTGDLVPDSSYSKSQTIKLPEAIYGTYYLLIEIDVLDHVFEFAMESNNITCSDSIQITLTPPPDFVVTDIKVPQTANSGKSILLEWTVENQGPGSAFENKWTDHIYLSKHTIFYPDSVYIVGAYFRSGDLFPDSSYVQQQVIIMPNGISGDYYVFVKTDADSQIFEHHYEDNNISRSSTPVYINLSPWPDLVVTSIEIPQTITSGQELTIAYSVTNQGIGNISNKSWKDELYISDLASWNSSEVKLLKVITNSQQLTADSTYTHSTSVTISNKFTGNYYLYIFTDVRNSVFENTEEGNNIKRSEMIEVESYPLIDISITEFSVPSTGSSGQVVNVQWKVSNIGLGKTLNSYWYDAIYLSSDSLLHEEEDEKLKNITHNGALGVGESYSREQDIALSNDISGKYYLIIKTDNGNSIGDVNPNNNIKAKVIDIGLTPLPDLQITSHAVPSECQSGQPINIEWTIQNTGAGPTLAPKWFDGIYLSTNSTFDNFDTRLDIQKHDVPLPVNAFYKLNLKITLPNYLSGTYYIILKTDTRDDVYETNEDKNNLQTIPIHVTMPPPSDLVVTNINVPDNAIPGKEITISYTVQNHGQYPAVGWLKDAIYFSQDKLWDIDDPMLGIIEHYIDLPPNSKTNFKINLNLAKSVLIDSTGNITGEMPGVTPGEYVAIVKTDIYNNIREDDLNNNTSISTDKIDVNVPELFLEFQISDTLRQGQVKYYYVNVDAGIDLRLTLKSDVTDASNEIYVAYNRVPTLSDFDYAASEPFSADQELIIPSTQKGIYYILLNSRNNIQPIYSLICEALFFSVLDITPKNVGKGQVTCKLSGAGFRETTDVFIKISQDSLYSAKIVNFNNTTELIIRWNFENIELGTYEIVAINNDGSIVSLNNGVTVEPVHIDLTHDLTHPSVLSALIPANFTFYWYNKSNVDIQYLNIEINYPTDVELKSIIADQFLELNSDYYYSLDEDTIQHIIDRKKQVIALIGKDIVPGEIIKCHVTFSNLPPWNYFPLQLYERILNKDEFVNELFYLTELISQSIVNNPSHYTPESNTLATQHPDSLRNLLLQFYIEKDLISYDDTDKIKFSTSFVSEQSFSPELMYDSYNNFNKQISNNSTYASGLPEWCDKGNMECRTFFEKECYDRAFYVCGITAAVGAGRTAFLCAIFYKHYCKLYPYKLCFCVIGSSDPNDIIGPSGYGDENWISQNKKLPYTIRFENDPELATAPAQKVIITQQFDSTLDIRSFRLGNFGFHDFTFDVPLNMSFYSNRLDLIDSLGIYVAVNAGIDVNTNEAFWIFKTVDPATGESPTDPFMGFLAINDSTGSGEGFVNYTIQSKSSSETGDIINAQARIVFDVNDPIDTPAIFNTIDADSPTSHIFKTEQIDSTSFILTWSGNDSTGSGIRDYSLYVAVDENPFEVYQNTLQDTAFVFNGETGHIYKFFILAADNAGNLEPMKSTAEATVLTTINFNNDIALPQDYVLYQSYPNPFNPITKITYALPENSKVKIIIYNIMGQKVKTLIDREQTAGYYTIRWNGVNDSDVKVATGVYLYSIETQEFAQTKKMLLLK